VLPAESELTSESDDGSPSEAAVTDASAVPEP
jgi:hypothetical protein